jgi:DNA polymerase I
MDKTLLAIDGNSLMHRAFYALPLMQNSKGDYTNSVYGFFTMLFSAIEKVKPDHIVVAFDKKGKVFRHEKFKEYKAGRKATPPELIPQFPLLKYALGEIGIKYLDCDGYEADDILGSFAKQGEENSDNIFILTGDRDAFQLISEKTKVFLTKKGVSESLIVDEKQLFDMYSMTPDQMIDMKGLMGDASDNIPGVKGVGEKTAIKLLSEYKTLEGVYENIEKTKGALKEKLVRDKENAFLSKEIGRVYTKLDCIGQIDDYIMPIIDGENLKPAFEVLEFKSLLRRFGVNGQEPPKSPKVEAKTIENIDGLKKLISQVENKKIMGLVLENNLFVALDNKNEYEIICEHSLLNSDFTFDFVLNELKPLFESKNIKKIVYNAKDLKHLLADYEISLNNLDFDIKLAAYVLDPTAKSFSLEAISENFDLETKAALVIKAADIQKVKLREDNLVNIYYDIEMPLMKVLFEMECSGFKVDKEILYLLQNEYDEKISKLIEKIYELSGYDDFNINSTKQLGDVLFERLKLPVQKKTKTGYSTDVEVLEKLIDKHLVIKEIIEYRKLTKLKSTYIDGLLNLVDSEGKIHSTFNQISTATGRISSTDPNLQNIPIRTQQGREIRKVFIPSLDDGVLVAADYSQIELRVLADIADDENMKDAFIKNQDIHARTASQVFDVPIDQVTSRLRGDAKAVNFGIVYGISGFGLARNLSISVNRATAYIDKYLEEFSGIAGYMKRIKKEAKEKGYVRTNLGRIRYIKELSSPNYNMRSFGERAALNTPIQGTAADIIKLAMIKVYEELEKRGLKSKLILQVHDELIVDTVKGEENQVETILKDTMENIVKMNVPLIANVSTGKTWFEAK